MANDDLIKNTNIEQIAEKGREIYRLISTQYEPLKNGRFLAIDVDTGEAFLADTGSGAIEAARVAHPNKIFYLVKIGHSAVEKFSRLQAEAL